MKIHLHQQDILNITQQYVMTKYIQKTGFPLIVTGKIYMSEGLSKQSLSVVFVHRGVSIGEAFGMIICGNRM